MPISITTNFDVNRSAPIDSRLTATDSNARNAILFKYPGLKVYQLDEQQTYVYGTDNTWTLDGGAIEGLGGIYNGDGILPKNVNVNFGTVSSNIGDTSRLLKFFSEDSLIFDQSQILNYFYRNPNGGQWRSMAYMIDHRLDNTSENTFEQSGFIGFNYETFYQDERGVLALGTYNSQIVTEKLPRILISPRDYIMFRNVNAAASLTIGFVSNASYLGVNYNPNTDNAFFLAEESQTIDPYSPAGRFYFGLRELKYQTRVAREDQGPEPEWEDSIFISNEKMKSEVSSNFQVMMDTSAIDWDKSTPSRTPELITIDKFIREIEHKFTKTQHLGQGSVNSYDGVSLILNNDGNSFSYTFDGNQTTTKSIKSILLRRDNIITDFPIGSIITITFFIENPGAQLYIDLIPENDTPKSGLYTIYSKISDETFFSNSQLTNPPNNRRLSIVQKAGTNIGDTMVFKKTSGIGWEIISVDRQARITQRNWLTSGPKNSTTSPWSFTTVSYLDKLTTPYKFTAFSNDTIDVIRDPTPQAQSLNRPPNSIIWSTTNQNGFAEENSDGSSFWFRISVDGNRLVNVQGNFRINLSSNDRRISRHYFDKQLNNRPNIWRIGKINQESLRPAWDTAWTYCSGFFYDTQLPASTYTMSEMYFSISKSGDMFVSYNLNSPQNTDIRPIVDVWVPPFTYTSTNSGN